MLQGFSQKYLHLNLAAFLHIPRIPTKGKELGFLGKKYVIITMAPLDVLGHDVIFFMSVWIANKNIHKLHVLHQKTGHLAEGSNS